MAGIAFTLDKSRIPLDKQEEIREVLRAWNKEGWLSWDKPKRSPSKKAAKNQYPEWFESFWKDLPIRVGKPDTLKACEEVFKAGYTLEDIRRGIPGYTADEARRSKAPDYQKHAPHRWIKNHRFLDDQNHSPDKQLKSASDILIEPLEKKLGIRIINSDRVMLMQILDTVTIEQLLAKARHWNKHTTFEDWLRQAYLEIIENA
jgi:hypothetical protein